MERPQAYRWRLLRALYAAFRRRHGGSSLLTSRVASARGRLDLLQSRPLHPTGAASGGASAACTAVPRRAEVCFAITLQLLTCTVACDQGTMECPVGSRGHLLRTLRKATLSSIVQGDPQAWRW